MKTAQRLLSLVSAIALVAAFALPTTGFAEKTRLGFGGGPEGGTFQYFSNGISTRLSKTLPEIEVSNTASAGSLENLRRVLELYAQETKALSHSVRLPGPLKLLREPIAQRLLDVMFEVAQALARDTAAAIERNRGQTPIC